MRRPVKNRPQVKPDVRFASVEVERLINYIMLRGQKETARKIVYGAFDHIKNAKDGGEPLEVFLAALKNAGPSMEVRSRRVGGANYQVPREVRPERREALALRWITAAARSGKGPMYKSLASELMLAAKEEGVAVKKKEDVHKMAEANRAFAHFAF